MSEAKNNNALGAGTVLSGSGRRYTVVRVLGQGGFGITYLATAPVRVENVTVKGSFAIKEHFLSSDCERDPATSRVVYSNPVKDRVESLRKDLI